MAANTDPSVDQPLTARDGLAFDDLALGKGSTSRSRCRKKKKKPRFLVE